MHANQLRRTEWLVCPRRRTLYRATIERAQNQTQYRCKCAPTMNTGTVHTCRHFSTRTQLARGKQARGRTSPHDRHGSGGTRSTGGRCKAMPPANPRRGIDARRTVTPSRATRAEPHTPPDTRRQSPDLSRKRGADGTQKKRRIRPLNRFLSGPTRSFINSACR